MRNQRLSFEEFQTLFRGHFESEEQLRKEYDSFRAVFERLDAVPMPELSSREKAEIFRRSWQGPRQDWSWAWAWLAFFRQPAVTFAVGLVFGCILMPAVLGPRSVLPSPAEQPLTIERTGYTQTYRGTIIRELYPQIENPRIVLERTAPSATPQRVLYGTINDGEIYVVWNL